MLPAASSFWPCGRLMIILLAAYYQKLTRLLSVSCFSLDCKTVALWNLRNSTLCFTTKRLTLQFCSKLIWNHPAELVSWCIWRVKNRIKRETFTVFVYMWIISQPFKGLRKKKWEGVKTKVYCICELLHKPWTDPTQVSLPWRKTPIYFSLACFS